MHSRTTYPWLCWQWGVGDAPLPPPSSTMQATATRQPHLRRYAVNLRRYAVYCVCSYSKGSAQGNVAHMTLSLM